MKTRKLNSRAESSQGALYSLKTKTRRNRVDGRFWACARHQHHLFLILV